MLLKAVVGLQVATMVVLAILFWMQGSKRLSVAQVCYTIATVVIFYK